MPDPDDDQQGLLSWTLNIIFEAGHSLITRSDQRRDVWVSAHSVIDDLIEKKRRIYRKDADTSYDSSNPSKTVERILADGDNGAKPILSKIVQDFPVNEPRKIPDDVARNFALAYKDFQAIKTEWLDSGKYRKVANAQWTINRATANHETRCEQAEQQKTASYVARLVGDQPTSRAR